MTHYAVVGANFGDEGKGILTDYLAADNCGLVVRANGGPQAGHTVVTPEGERQVFSHLGAGTLAGVPTLLGPQFLVNPAVFWPEYQRLGNVLWQPGVLIDPTCRVTTPYDMMINTAVETVRGGARHGSVGYGIHETVMRVSSAASACVIRAIDFYDPNKLREKLAVIWEEWVPDRLAAHGYPELRDGLLSGIDHEGLVSRWVSDATMMALFVGPTSDNMIRATALTESVVFEGAQGLLLDQDHRWAPYVTHSRTGAIEPALLARASGIQELEVIYVTRAYLTRHGAGPLPNELYDGLPYPGVYDNTNVPHPFQGTLRYAYLDVGLLEASIANDLRTVETEVPELTIIPKIAITCCDQVGDESVHWFGGGGKWRHEGTLTDLVDAMPLPVAYMSWGPSRNHVLPGHLADIVNIA